MITWNEKLGESDCPYLIRWVLDLKFISFRLHHWIKSDDQRNFHDHPWNFITIILKGEYVDVTPTGQNLMQPFHIYYRKAEHKHTVRIDSKGVWTFLITGPVIRRWGFWVKNKFFNKKRYFLKFGHHPCE